MDCTAVLYFACFALGTAQNGVRGTLGPVPTNATEYQGSHTDIFKNTSVTTEPPFSGLTTTDTVENETGSSHWNRTSPSADFIQKGGYPTISTAGPLAPTGLRAENLDGAVDILLTFTPPDDILLKHYDIYYTDDPALPDDQWTKEQALGAHTQAVICVSIFQKKNITIKMRTVTDEGAGEFGAKVQHYVEEPSNAGSAGDITRDGEDGDGFPSTGRVLQTLQTTPSSSPESHIAVVDNEITVLHFNRTFQNIPQNPTAPAVTTTSIPRQFKSAEVKYGTGSSHYNQTFERLFQMIGNLTGAVLQSRPHSAPEFRNVPVETGTGIGHINQTFERIFDMIGKLTDAVSQTRCHVLEPKASATWLLRDADTLWSLNHTIITATVRSITDGMSACQPQEFTAITNEFGEISLALPKKSGLQFVVTFEVAGYYPIALRKVHLDESTDVFNTFMEPLLFIPRRFTGSGTVEGVFQNLSNGSLTGSIIFDIRADMNSHTGITVETFMTPANGAWSVTLPGGHYTVTASKSGYITIPFTLVVVGGETREDGYSGMSPTIYNGGVRIVSIGGGQTTNLALYIHVRSPVQGTAHQFHTMVQDINAAIPDSFVRYELNQWGVQSVLIEKQLAGDYRISISDGRWIDKSRNGTLWDMANSAGTVHLYTGSKLWAQYFVPNRVGNAWSVVVINGTHLETINKVTTVASMEDVNKSE